ncbi:MAG: hypothetical protein WC262_11535 [Bacteroidales bacterium]
MPILLDDEYTDIKRSPKVTFVVILIIASCILAYSLGYQDGERKGLHEYEKQHMEKYSNKTGHNK